MSTAPASALARRLAYKPTKGSNAKRTGTKSQFGKDKKVMSAEPEQPSAPTYAFVDQQRGQQDTVADESASLRSALQAQDKDEEKDIVDRKDFTPSGPSASNARPTPAVTTNKVITKFELGGAFAKAWTVVDHISIPPVVKEIKSWFLPNCIMLFNILSAMEDCLAGNEEMKWVCAHYFSLPVRLYYSVMFYVQILKAKEAAGKLTKAQGSWFRAFKRAHKLESLPIAGPLLPYFSNIVAVKPDDDKYDFVYPDYSAPGFTITANAPAVHSNHYLVPSVPLLAELLRQFTTLTRATLQGKTGGEYDYFDDSEAYVPHRTGVAFTFGTMAFPHPLTAQYQIIMNNPALDVAMKEDVTSSLDILSYWKKSKATKIPALTANEDFSTLGKLLRMEEDFEWFESCVHMAAVQAKFFTDSVNMSQVPSTGGNEVLLTAEITGNKATAPASTAWFPGNWTSLKAKFRTTRADTDASQMFNASYACSTGSLHWNDANGHVIGGRQNGCRIGPYWDNREFEFELDNDVPVARGLSTMIRSQFYDAHGKAS